MGKANIVVTKETHQIFLVTKRVISVIILSKGEPTICWDLAYRCHGKIEQQLGQQRRSRWQIGDLILFQANESQPIP